MPCGACNQGYDPMNAYQPEIVMNAQSLVGFAHDGSPVYMDSMSERHFQGTSERHFQGTSERHYQGTMKDGTPVFMPMATSTDPVNLLGTVAFIAAGASLGWLLTGAVIGYLK